MAAPKIVDYILAIVEKDAFNDFMRGFNAKFKFATVVNSPANIRFFRMNIFENEYFTCSSNADDNLQDLEQCPITRLRIRER